jgi:hypothetical protein
MSDRGHQQPVSRRGALRQGAGLVACAAALPLLTLGRPAAGSGATPPAEPPPEPEPGPPAARGEAAGVTLPPSVAGVRIPDSRLARAAATLAQEASPAHLYNHVMRSYVFAALLFDRRGTRYDRELAFVACALHDLGLVEEYMTPTERFEVDGADAARRFLERWHVPPRRVELVWDAIALHTNSGIAARKAPEIAMVSLGAAADAAGLNLDQVSGDAVDAVLDAFPRLGFKQASLQTILSLCERKPFAHLLHPFAEVGRRHIPGFPVPTVEDLMFAAPFAE